MKYIITGAAVAALFITGTAFAAYGNMFVKGTLWGVIEDSKGDTKVYKLVDGSTTCYVAEWKAGVAMDCK